MASNISCLYSAIKEKKWSQAKRIIIEGGVNTSEQLETSILNLTIDKVNDSKGLQFLKYLITKKGHDVNEEDEDGVTPLATAIFKGYIPTILFLIESGCDINAIDQSGETPLTLSAGIRDRDEVIKILLVSGAELKKRNINDMNALEIAISNQDIHTAKNIISYGTKNGLLSEKPSVVLQNEELSYFWDESKQNLR